MAWKAYEFDHTDRASIFAALQALMIEVGWELHDAIDADTAVYKSNGESGNEPYGYIHIDAGTSTYIEFTAYQYWNSDTHVGTRKMWAYNTQTNSRITATYIGGTNVSTIMFGDKDMVGVYTNSNSTSAGANGSGVCFGHLQGRFDNVLVDADGTAGTAGTLSVATTSGLGVGKYVQIVGGTSGCDLLQITELTSANTIKVAALPHNYGTGAKIGSPASTFGIVAVGSTLSSRWHQTSFYGDAGTTVGSAYITIAQLSSPTLYAYQSHFSKKYQLVPYIIATDSASSPGIMLGYVYRNMMYATYSYGYDCFLENDDGGFPISGTVSEIASETLTDSRQSWGVNEHAGRFVIIVSGTGIGQVRKITSNTATALTLQSSWTTNPDLSSDYKICDTVWRCLPAVSFGSATSVKLTDTVAPS